MEIKTNQRYELQSLISRISSAVVLCPYSELDRQIEQCLGWLAEILHADRSYLFMVRDSIFIDNSHEWCSQGIVPQKEQLQGLELNENFPMARQILNHETIHYPDVANLSDEQYFEREFLQNQSIGQSRRITIKAHQCSSTQMCGLLVRQSHQETLENQGPSQSNVGAPSERTWSSGWGGSVGVFNSRTCWADERFYHKAQIQGDHGLH